MPAAPREASARYRVAHAGPVLVRAGKPLVSLLQR